MITEQQYQRLMKEYQKSGRVKTAAMKAGMDRKTARDYLRDKRGPKQRRKARPVERRSDFDMTTIRLRQVSEA